MASSGSGKTQFLLNLSLAVQLQKPRGLGRRAIYISTEHPLSTPRLSQILECHPVLSTLPVEEAPSLQGVLSINAMDMETQDHILNFHLPVAIERYNVGLVIIDSITSNYRAEYQNDKDAMTNRSTHLARLGHFLRNLAVKHDIAIVLANQVSDRFEQANPDRLATQAEFPYSQSEAAGEESGPASPKFRTELLASELGTQIPPSSPGLPSSPHNTPDQQAHGSYQVPQPHNEKLDMELQERFFTGWGDDYLESESRKNPALGFIWTTQIACRIALKKQQHASGTDEHSTSPVPVTVTTPGSPSQTHYHGDPTTFEDQDSIAMPAPVPNRVSDTQDHRPALGSDLVKGRTMKLVFSPWTAGSEDHSGEEEETERSDEVEFEIWEGGLRSTNHVD